MIDDLLGRSRVYRTDIKYLLAILGTAFGMKILENPRYVEIDGILLFS